MAEETGAEYRAAGPGPEEGAAPEEAPPPPPPPPHEEAGPEVSKAPSILGPKRHSSLKQKYIGGVITVRRQSMEMVQMGKVTRYMNTYKLWADRRFRPEKAEIVLKNILEETMSNISAYSPVCSIVAKKTAVQIRQKIKELDFDRCKYLCQVCIGEKAFQTYKTVARFLWDYERDSYAYYVIDKPFIFAYAIVFAIYHE